MPHFTLPSSPAHCMRILRSRTREAAGFIVTQHTVCVLPANHEGYPDTCAEAIGRDEAPSRSPVNTPHEKD